ncbi:hypothetical protein [Mobiluncus mulieris]|uniref:hypothetical protein n=1 Tax=Mobiluncus mulieris TaxID=2052 RepID=UPI001B8C5BD9|nr:hypothetical protein [Mobiluncus mulieris]
MQIETSLEENWNPYAEANPHTAPIKDAESIRKAEISEDGTVFDNVDDAVKFLDASPGPESVAKPE